MVSFDLQMVRSVVLYASMISIYLCFYILFHELWSVSNRALGTTRPVILTGSQTIQLKPYVTIVSQYLLYRNGLASIICEVQRSDVVFTTAIIAIIWLSHRRAISFLHLRLPWHVEKVGVSDTD